MKTESYEKMVDGIIEKLWLLLWYMVHGFIIFLTFGIIFSLLDKLVFTEIALNFFWVVIIPSIITPIPPTIFVFYYRKAKRIYKIKRCRDFWMGLAVKVKSQEIKGNDSEIDEWIRENIRHMHKKTDRSDYLFVSKADVVAFKLMWA